MIPLFAALFGLLAGSFANVCILRIPAGESVVLPPSRCPACKARLRPWELVPLLSYLFLRGRCAHCGVRISPRYPLTEALCALLWVVCAFVFGAEQLLLLILGCLLATLLLVIAFIDARIQEIPPACNLLIAALGLVRLGFDLAHWKDYALGLAAVSVPLLLVFYLSGGRGIGGGDVKMMAACGLLLGWRSVLLGFVAACMLGSAVHLVRMKFFGAGRSLALAPYLAAGAFVAFLWGEPLLAWYLSLILRP